MLRREFIKKIGIGTAAIGGASAMGVLSGCGSDNSVKSEEKQADFSKSYTWKMATTWPPHFPILGEGADNFAQWVEEMSSGRLKIKVYGGGELVPPLQVFDAVNQGTVQMGHGTPSYWAGKVPASQFFASVPFGFNAQSFNSWIYCGGGIELWREAYADFNLKPFAGGNTGVQMGGWFNKEVKSIKDLKGLKMRMPGLGGKVLAKAGANAILVAGGEIYTALDRGVIDATEWIGPYHDLMMGFYKAAKYYYYPGWHEPGPGLEILVNKEAFDSLPQDLQFIIEAATFKSNMQILSEFEAKNNEALQILIKKHKVKLRRFPDTLLKKLKGISREVLEELAAKDPVCRKVYDSFLDFQKNIYSWNRLTEEIYQTFKYL
jgi:TRAP-type mannitol/chloroaromatic compound transport system substrate-binding protein